MTYDLVVDSWQACTHDSSTKVSKARNHRAASKAVTCVIRHAKCEQHNTSKVETRVMRHAECNWHATPKAVTSVITHATCKLA